MSTANHFLLSMTHYSRIHVLSDNIFETYSNITKIVSSYCCWWWSLVISKSTVKTRVSGQKSLVLLIHEIIAFRGIKMAGRGHKLN